jgi:hypothetical protein
MSITNDIQGTINNALNAQAETANMELKYQTAATGINTKFKTESDTLQSIQAMNKDASDGAKYQ